MTKVKLQMRKQEAARDALYEAAVELFTVKGFDETKIEEIAQAAGISRRTFFHYYATKDDLLARSVVNYGSLLTQTVAACPPSFTVLEILQETVRSVAKQTSTQPHLRQLIEISQSSISARKAYISRLVEVEDSVSEAYSKRFRGQSGFDVDPRLLAQLTITVLNVAITDWFMGRHSEVSSSVNHVLSRLTFFICDRNCVPSGIKAKASRPRVNPSKQSRGKD